MERFQGRTDLALEATERFEDGQIEISGVKITEYQKGETDIKITKVAIETENGSKMMGKPRGIYLTLEAPDMPVPDEGYHREISRELAAQLRELLGDTGKERSVLVVGLGNREVTPDALGPDVVGNLQITRHILREYGKAAEGLAQYGIELDDPDLGKGESE